MSFWDSVKRDLQKSLKEGIAFVREGAVVVKVKAEELTEEAKRQYKIFDLKTSVKRELTELGGRVYDLRSKIGNPMMDKKVKAAISRIRKLETQITKLEIKPKRASNKRT